MVLSPEKQIIFLFSKMLILALGPTEPPIQWRFPWKYSGCGVMQNTHIRLEPILGRSGGIPPLLDMPSWRLQGQTDLHI